MKKHILAVLFCILVIITAVGCNKEEKWDAQPKESHPKNTEQTASIEVLFEKKFKDETAEEYAVLKGMLGSEEKWVYETEQYAITELEAVELIAVLLDRIYLNEAGTITAIDRKTGKILWKNEDFEGRGISYALDGEDRIFLCGYYGPNFFEVNASGKTVKKIESFYEDLVCPTEMKYANGKVSVLLQTTEKEQWVTVELQDYSYEQVERPVS